MSFHSNDGACVGCPKTFDKYPNFHAATRAWFVGFQAKHPEAHISCAGRGHADQDAALKSGASRAAWTESGHNWNCAYDIFVMLKGLDLYDKNWFQTVLAPELPPELIWYGAPGAVFYERPHVELNGWRKLANSGLLVLVEP